MIFEEYLEEHFAEDWDTDWPESPVLEDGLEYVMGSGGKRLRPLLCLKLCEALEGDLDQASVFSRAIEVYHNFTLVHDDIIDKDIMRRGEDAVWIAYGLSQGIDIGDALHAQAYTYLIDNADLFDPGTFQELLAVLNQADRSVLDGQSLDFSFRSRDDISEEAYMAMVEKKTGALLAAALKGAGVIAEVDETTMERIERFGRQIGPAFQIRDDIIDIVGEKGRTRGNDIREGKRSLIVVKALDRLSADDGDELRTILDREKEDTTDEDVVRAIELFEKTDAISEANSVAEERVDEALTVLDTLSESFDMGDVREITTFITERKF